MKKSLFIIFYFLKVVSIHSQVDSIYSLTFNFNEHKFKEVDNKVKIKPVGVYLTRDRFGNEASAVYLQGSVESYLNLGTSPLLKSTVTTISMWVNLDRRVYTGKGYEGNPMFLTKNSSADDFNVAYQFFYDGYSNRFISVSTKDATKEAIITSKSQATFGVWHHFVLTSDNNYFAFYIDGELQGKVVKNFETVFLTSDSVIVGHTANKKNLRFSQGSFDDIQVFHRVLNAAEVKDLYNAPNPNRFNLILFTVLKIIVAIAIVLVIAFLLVASRRRSLKREREKFELKSRMSEMEIKVIKAQINPHFMSNCLAAVQHLIMNHKLDAANEYLAKFGFIVRQVLNFSTKSLVALKEELEIVVLNVDLEQLRFEDKFAFSLHVEAGIDQNQTLIPPLLFQPIIENAIWHGLLPLKCKARAQLKIDISQENELLKVIIEDNGVGRKKINENIGNSKDSKGMKITFQRIANINGLYNINTSEIIYEDLVDDEHKPSGTRVIIYLPTNLSFKKDD